MSGPVTTDGIKARMRITDTTDDAWLASVADAVNDWVSLRVGMDLVPGGSATRKLDGDGTRELFVPGGLRSVLVVQVSTDWWSTFASVTDSVTLLPEDWRRPASEPYHTLRLAEESGLVFPAGERTVLVTSAEWGYAAWPSDVVEVAETIAVRMHAARVTGQRDVIGSDATGAPLVSRFVSGKDRETIDAHRFANSDFGYL